MIELVLGGARSGKSRYAESVVCRQPGPWIYVATGRAWDEEMRARIARHQLERGAGWLTVEEPVALSQVLRDVGEKPVLVDCLTLWLSNLLLEEHNIPEATHTLLEVLTARQGLTVLVGNEVGLGIVPDNALARRFRDEAGWLHQKIAAVADRVVLTVAGFPLVAKPAGGKGTV
ncbi:bifunctional adenosylcobinamide kinase/adenosylcobinamide-phosphate guanylyltransferase [Acetobacter oeni]|uniref:Bifunctional adenosylcobalamin biosynthesis protein n=1 Tax=Acetobacter oeni TaxID=304077 RepID=A0A511XKP5_9PROT|nr:bifunctional adenosylcobinamide kinase/adenosylcobinamide-phosphate guanylyltransferase [Acetobacter oeni]MBB3883761.1 adenosylcobinamide kinase/adenosylcobinamide-phosphate guanylyltransferase [Acetobacter oeni]NHO19893.1 bifunctional adenosylcobinamide kinase/adenosylcobinamide-phosphate guanylyltransferase [Acetobacter oeni]GBR10315.1 adenosylcobalamin biosynthesis bifunctional protein CobP [Acetobacter oeni LMG 21952]GEN63516.1 adenosylcobinamide kinase/adenosylcobinamide phosphate guany